MSLFGKGGDAQLPNGRHAARKAVNVRRVRPVPAHRTPIAERGDDRAWSAAASSVAVT